MRRLVFIATATTTAMALCAALTACELALGVDRTGLPPDASLYYGACGCACVTDPLPSCIAAYNGEGGTSPPDGATDTDADDTDTGPVGPADTGPPDAGPDSTVKPDAGPDSSTVKDSSTADQSSPLEDAGPDADAADGS